MRGQSGMVRLLDPSGGEPVCVLAQIEIAVHSATGGSGFPDAASARVTKAFVSHPVL